MSDYDNSGDCYICYSQQEVGFADVLAVAAVDEMDDDPLLQAAPPEELRAGPGAINASEEQNDNAEADAEAEDDTFTLFMNSSSMIIKQCCNLPVQIPNGALLKNPQCF